MKYQTPLCEIAHKHRTDKCPQINHIYTPIYYDLLKDKNIKKVVEIGIGSERMGRVVKNYKVGASLYMWREFLPDAHIYGVDIEPQTMLEEDRITTLLCDVSVKGNIQWLVDQIGTDVDLFIDDGSHILEEQINLCKWIKPLLKKDVIYVIEDVYKDRTMAKLLSEYKCDVPFVEGRKSGRSKLVIVSEK